MFQWKPEYAIGHETIDRQHQRLFAICTMLHGASLDRQRPNVLAATLASLLAYCRAHFAAEEALMREWEYPDAAAHQERHRDFTTKIERLYNDFREGRTDIGVHLFQFVQRWLTAHILEEDMAIAAHRRSQKPMLSSSSN